MHTQTFDTDLLGFAAFLKIKGAKLTAKQGRRYLFESERDKQDWYLEYLVSPEAAYNTALMQLRQL